MGKEAIEDFSVGGGLIRIHRAGTTPSLLTLNYSMVESQELRQLRQPEFSPLHTVDETLTVSYSILVSHRDIFFPVRTIPFCQILAERRGNYDHFGGVELACNDGVG